MVGEEEGGQLRGSIEGAWLQGKRVDMRESSHWTLLQRKTHHADTGYTIATLRRLREHDVCFVLAKIVLHLLRRRSFRHRVSSLSELWLAGSDSNVLHVSQRRLGWWRSMGARCEWGGIMDGQ